jgi:hypothetical protein
LKGNLGGHHVHKLEHLYDMITPTPILRSISCFGARKDRSTIPIIGHVWSLVAVVLRRLLRLISASGSSVLISASLQWILADTRADSVQYRTLHPPWHVYMCGASFPLCFPILFVECRRSRALYTTMPLRKVQRVTKVCSMTRGVPDPTNGYHD